MVYSTTDATGRVSITVNTSRFDGYFIKAQNKLDQMVLGDSTPYVPFQQGALRSSGKIIKPGLLQWGSDSAPYAHYQYMGELYLDANGSSWAKKDTEKYPSGRSLTYHEPGTGAEWVEKAKEVHGKMWVSTVKKIAGGGI